MTCTESTGWASGRSSATRRPPVEGDSADRQVIVRIRAHVLHLEDDARARESFWRRSSSPAAGADVTA